MKPNTTHTEHDQSTETPTLRDQFAMAALTGRVSAIHEEDITWYTKRAYQIADAMMEARK